MKVPEVNGVFSLLVDRSLRTDSMYVCVSPSCLVFPPGGSLRCDVNELYRS